MCLASITLDFGLFVGWRKASAIKSGSSLSRCDPSINFEKVFVTLVCVDPFFSFLSPSELLFALAKALTLFPSCLLALSLNPSEILFCPS